MRSKFLLECANIKDFNKIKYLVVAVQLPTGAVEIITNSEDIEEKIRYYTVAYNEDFRLVNCNDVRVLNYMIVQ